MFIYNMNNPLLFIIGIVAGVGTTVSFLPQVFKLCRATTLKDIEGVSIYMYLIHFIGVFSWIIYGTLMKDNFIITFNTICSLLVIFSIYKIVAIHCKNDEHPNTIEVQDV